MKRIILIAFSLCTMTLHAQEDANTLYVDSLLGQLPEVMVKGERPVVKARQGKLVYDMARLLDQQPVSNAYEALKELPGVIEQEGDLSLGGRGVSVIINGKVSTMSREQLKTLLESTPVSRLEKAEVMAVAPARFGIRGALINVVLKKTVGQPSSLSGEVSGTALKNTEGTLSGRGNLLYASDRFSVDAMYKYTDAHTFGNIEKTSWHTVAGQLHEMALDTRISGRGKRHDYRLGMDFDLGKKHQLGIVYNGNHRSGYDHTVMEGTATSDRMSDGIRILHNVKADYQSPFGLTAGMDFLYYDSPTDENLRSSLQGKEEGYAYKSNQRINRWLIYLNQVHALNNDTELNYGVRYTTTHDHSHQTYMDGETGEMLADRSAKDLRKEYTLNMYAGASHSFNENLSGELSVATELYDARGRHTWNLYPTVNLTYQPADGQLYGSAWESVVEAFFQLHFPF